MQVHVAQVHVAQVVRYLQVHVAMCSSFTISMIMCGNISNLHQSFPGISHPVFSTDDGIPSHSPQCSVQLFSSDQHPSCGVSVYTETSTNIDNYYHEYDKGYDTVQHYKCLLLSVPNCLCCVLNRVT